MDNVQVINQAVDLFFRRNTALDVATPKDLLPILVELDFFTKEQIAGWPLRQLLDQLDKEGAIKQIPTIKPVRKKNETYWFFVREKKSDLKLATHE